MSKIGMLLVGHGSKLPYNKELIETTAEFIAEKADEYIVKPGFMSINTPSVEDQLDAFRAENINMLVVVPLFLARGIHIDKDIPKLLGLPEGGKKG
ncbi:MAG: sirohydrochlorin nickelochelatase, partial [Methanomicrobiales archaeon]|nr:sirohydrochlorin nickelochelatase [Methanomicrobiales archaeon]